MQRQPRRQDTFQLRDQEQSTQNTYQQQQQQQQQMQAQQRQQQQQQQQQQYAQQQQQGGQYYTDDEEHSIIDDESLDDQYLDEDDGSSSLSIPSESIDFDLVYSIQTFVATVEGQANVVKGDSLVLMDDSNSYWWLVRVLKTGEVGYIPAENIETAFERLARLNKHRNVDLASATQAERQEDVRATRERMRAQMARNSPYVQHNSKSVIFTGSFMVHQYPAFIWGNENDQLSSEEEDYESYDEGEDAQYEDHPDMMEPDDGMSWDDSAGQRAQEDHVAETSRDPRLQQQQDGGVPASLRPGGGQVQASQQQQRSAQPAANQAQLGLGTAPSARAQPSRDRVQSGQQQQDSRQQGGSPSGRQFVDPLESGETKKISVTPNIARGPSDSSRQQQEPAGKRSTSPATVTQQRTGSQQALHRSVSAESAGSLGSRDSSKKSMETSSISSKLKKSGRSTPEDDSGGEGASNTKEKKKKTGMFSGLFSSKKKDKDKKEKGGKGVTSSTGTDGDSYGRGSDDSTPPNNNSPAEQPTATFSNRRPQADSRKPAGPSSSAPQVSSHASRLAQKDLQEQALYQQYLNRSPASPPDPSLSYGLQSAATLGLAPSSTNNSLTAERPRNSRPGSLIITGNVLEGAFVPELSVMRVFAGENLQSEATFKTVLLNSTTTSSELVRQAMQRFRLPHAEDPSEYFLTIKQYEGDEAILRKEEKPLEIFEELVESALNIPTVKRSSISSISSNLSMQPAITRLAMNDFTDDSTVKLYLNRRSAFPEGISDIPDEDGMTPTQSTEGPSIRADDSMASIASRDPVDAALSRLNGRPQLSVNTPGNTPERFSAPSGRFSMQVVIYPEDLPDGLVFDPQTEAIIPRSSLQSRAPASATPAAGVNQQYRKKVFVFPKNTTVAEVIEQSLDMFGIQEGVVDGGDEIEDKSMKRMSRTRVRYGLAVHVPTESGGGERELNPSSKVLEAFPRPPAFKQLNRRSTDLRRRSLDASQLLGSMDDVQQGDPVFILKRATTYRSASSRHRLSAPLDDVALHHVHQRESVTSENSVGSEYTSESPRAKQPQLSQRELIAAQRAASRAKQSAILETRPNEEQGVDLLLPDKGVIRSARSGVDERMLYSYVQPDGETYDISDIIEEELWDVGQDRRSGGSRAGRPSMDDEDEVSPISVARAGSRTGSNRGDLLEGVLVKPSDVVEQRIDQVLAKIKDGKRRSSLSSYATDASKQHSKSLDDRRSPTPRSGSATGQHQEEPSRSLSNTPVYQGRASPQPPPRSGGTHSQQPSIASLMSDYTPDNSTGMKSSTTERTTPGTANRPPIIMKDDFGMSKMMAVIEANANAKKPPPTPPMSEVEELLFGSNLQLEDLHPAARDLFAPMFEHMENVNKQLDLLLQQTFRA